MNNVSNYLNNKKSIINEKIKDYDLKINTLEYEIENIDLKIEEISKNIDTTFSVFSPNVINDNYISDEINSLKSKKNDAENLVLKIKEKRNKSEIELKTLDELLQDTAANNSRYEKEIEKANTIKKEYKNKLNIITSTQTNLSQLYIEKYNYNLEEILSNVNNCLYKEKLCENFINVDINRCKIELEEIKQILNTMQQKGSLLGYYKYKKNDEIELLENSIETRVNEYKGIYKKIFDYSFYGEKIYLDSTITTNIIAILDEIVNNAFYYTESENISIVVNCERENLNNMIVSLDNSNEKIVNFNLDEDTSSKKISISVQDSGGGFKYDESILKSEKKYGFKIIKERLKLINGKLNVDSTNGIGSTITFEFIIEK